MTDVSEFGAFLVQLHDAVSTDGVIQHAVQTALRVIDCNAAGVMLIRGDKQIATAASSDDTVKRADLLQFELGEGPCLAGHPSGDNIRIDNTTTDERWPTWCHVSPRSGFAARSVWGRPTAIRSPSAHFSV